MDERNDPRKAAEALAAVRTHQERADKAARLPWWVYALTFVASAGLSAANDFVDLAGAKFIAAVVVVLLIVTFVAGLLGRGTAPLSRVRGVQPRQQIPQWAFATLVVVGAAGVWVIISYGGSVATALADAVGLPGYPDTVAGVVFGAAFTLLFALSQFALGILRKRADR
ncbi:hypothetical protein GCM10022222_63310 [Amycolatopsis ultiminotia]|uniref:Uncharacterized protein n=1 Tax=Amycolatopsis ultiminotia TaxID=543629 RepID=A0ABP6XQP9_9PSEU